MNDPTVSVLLSSYNHEKYIRRTIESVLDQSFGDFELIIVDDGSADDSREVINSYKDPRIKTFFLSPNQGMGMAFNSAVMNATGKYLARIDSDDFWTLDKLEKQTNYMEAHPETGACFSWVKVIDENEDPLPPSPDYDIERMFAPENKSQSEWLHHFYTKGNSLAHTSAFIRREAIGKVGIYNYSLKQLQDLDLWIRIAKQYPLHVICEPLVFYRWFISSIPNVSAPTPEVVTRAFFEFFYLLHDFHRDLSDDLFAAAFRADFSRKNAATHDELLCERAFLLLNKPPYLARHGGKSIALLMLNQLLQNDDTRKILNETYNFSIKDYNILCAEKLFSDSPSVQEAKVQGAVHGEITLKNLIKKHLQTNPGLFAVARKIYRKACKP